MKFMRNGLLVLSLLALCSEAFPRSHGGGGHHGGGHHGGGHYRGGGRGYHRGGYRHGRGGFGFGLGVGLGAVGVGLGYNNWRYGGWNTWNGRWWNTSPYWYVGHDWNSLSLRTRLSEINNQIRILENEDDNYEATAQLEHLRRRRDELARQL